MTTWTPIAQFFASGDPVATPRPRARAIRTYSEKKRKHVWIAQVYNTTDADGWKQRITAFGHRHQPDHPIDGPVRVDIEFRLPRPQRLMRKCDPEGPVPCFAKPDRDNLEKAVLDAMTKAGWWKDDGQVCAGQVRKMYAGKREATGAWIKISVPVNEPALFEGAGK